MGTKLSGKFHARFHPPNTLLKQQGLQLAEASFRDMSAPKIGPCMERRQFPLTLRQSRRSTAARDTHHINPNDQKDEEFGSWAKLDGQTKRETNWT